MYKHHVEREREKKESYCHTAREQKKANTHPHLYNNIYTKNK